MLESPLHYSHFVICSVFIANQSRKLIIIVIDANSYWISTYIYVIDGLNYGVQESIECDCLSYSVDVKSGLLRWSYLGYVGKANGTVLQAQGVQ